jgi:hypothetical protein
MNSCNGASTESLPEDPGKRVSYALGMVLGFDESQQEQRHIEWKHRLGNLLSHGVGTLSGLQVSLVGSSDDLEVHVSPGYAIGPQRRWIRVREEQCGRLGCWLREQEGELETPLASGTHRVYVTLCYQECPTDPVTIPAATCTTFETSTAPSRILETSELRLVWQPPEQTVETGTRAFGDLLRQLEIHQGPLSPLDPPDDSEAFLDRVRQLGAPSSPPPAPPPGAEVLRLWPAAACDTLRRALTVWTTEIQPGLQETADACLLLASIDFEIDTDGRLVPNCARLDDATRPLLVPTRLQQELFCQTPNLVRPIIRIPYLTTWLVQDPLNTSDQGLLSFCDQRLSGQDLALIGPFKRLGHRFVEIVDKRENFVFQRIFREEIATLDHLFHQNTKPDFDLIHP